MQKMALQYSVDFFQNGTFQNIINSLILMDLKGFVSHFNWYLLDCLFVSFFLCTSTIFNVRDCAILQTNNYTVENGMKRKRNSTVENSLWKWMHWKYERKKMFERKHKTWTLITTQRNRLAVNCIRAFTPINSVSNLFFSLHASSETEESILWMIKCRKCGSLYFNVLATSPSA